MIDKLIKNIKKGHRIQVFGFLCLIVLYASANTLIQNPPPKTSLPATQTNAATGTVHSSQVGNKKLIKLVQAGYIIQRENFEPQVLLDSVILTHDGATMYCDSAYLTEATNSFEAFGNIRVVQGDTLFLYGKKMYYNGNNKLLEIRKDVRLENDKDMTLFTDSLNYDRVANLAYYFDGGMLVDKDNELTSFWGQYQPSLKLATFRDSVKLVNERFTMYSEVLKYQTETKIANIVGKTTIVSDSGTIYSTNGWYNTVTEESLLLDRSIIVSKDGSQTLTGDSISKKGPIGEAFGNIHLQDTLKKVILKGNYGLYNERTSFAMATDSASCIEYSQGDSLYLHADSLFLITDTLIKNSREVRAYNNVRFFRSDIQGVCDSMIYRSQDSALYLYKEPILWNENQQIMGDTIEIYLNDSTIEKAHIKKYCFAIQDIDSLHYNQLKGREMQIFFNNKQVRHVLVEGNAESIFYPEEEDKTMIGMNQTESSYLSMDFRDRKIEKIKLWTQTSGTLTPLPDLKPDMMTLRDFQWFDYIRPLNKDDIFRKVKKKAGSEGPRRSSRFTNLDL